MGRRRKWQPAIDAAQAAIEAEGFSVSFVDYVEDAETPGLLGQAAGVTDAQRRKVKVRRGLTGEQTVEVLEHELRHVRGAEDAGDCRRLGLACGGRRNPFGERVG